MTLALKFIQFQAFLSRFFTSRHYFAKFDLKAISLAITSSRRPFTVTHQIFPQEFSGINMLHFLGSFFEKLHTSHHDLRSLLSQVTLNEFVSQAFEVTQ